MTPHHDLNRGQSIRYAPRVFGLACLLLAVAGCTNFWDEMLSNERDWNYAFGRRPDPMIVLKDSKDGTTWEVA